MPSMLVTVNISRGFKTWTIMSKKMQDYTDSGGAKIVWAAINPDETAARKILGEPAEV